MNAKTLVDASWDLLWEEKTETKDEKLNYTEIETLVEALAKRLKKEKGCDINTTVHNVTGKIKKQADTLIKGMFEVDGQRVVNAPAVTLEKKKLKTLSKNWPLWRRRD